LTDAEKSTGPMADQDWTDERVNAFLDYERDIGGELLSPPKESPWAGACGISALLDEILCQYPCTVTARAYA
jgi:hypothetical protein